MTLHRCDVCGHLIEPSERVCFITVSNLVFDSDRAKECCDRCAYVFKLFIWHFFNENHGAFSVEFHDALMNLLCEDFPREPRSLPDGTTVLKELYPRHADVMEAYEQLLRVRGSLRKEEA